MYNLGTRYYDPEIGRFINADSVVAGVGGDLKGYNLFAYCFNNPVNMDDQTGNFPKWMKDAANWLVKKTEKSLNDISNYSKYATKKISSVFNVVSKFHVTTPTALIDFGYLFGKIGFSTTLTNQNKKAKLFHSYSNIGADKSEYGTGINVIDWLGINIGVSTSINSYLNVQITPWVHSQVSVGADGVGFVFGVDDNEISYDFEFKGGWGLIAVLCEPKILPFASGNLILSGE